ncbi:unnamed protein product [Owenia fusiformis]|uniref:Clathrin light chain n=1 Tax=Owenia fusiformis TaxID=6347 RepID=A0A8S4N1T4_OWEFU|nr:unnamed protein product [Owenia fusiformis]
MADLLNDQPPQEEDPAAAFLAEQNEQLAGLEDDSSDAAPVQQQAGSGDFDAFAAPAASEDANVQDMFGFTPPADDQQQATSGGGLLNDDIGGGFDPMAANAEGDAQSGVVTEDLGNDVGGYDAFSSDAPQENGPSDAYSAISQIDVERKEPEKIILWREEQKERLQQKDVAEEKEIDELRQVAKKELEDWYKHHTEQVEKTKETNKASEAAFVEERDETSSDGQWERICRLCEFNPKTTKMTKDVSRMRSILLNLKQTPLVR